MFIHLGKYIINTSQITYITLSKAAEDTGKQYDGCCVSFACPQGDQEGFNSEFLILTEEQACRLLTYLNVK